MHTFGDSPEETLILSGHLYSQDNMADPKENRFLLKGQLRDARGLTAAEKLFVVPHTVNGNSVGDTSHRFQHSKSTALCPFFLKRDDVFEDVAHVRSSKHIWKVLH